MALTSFVGRRREVAEIRRTLGSARLLTLTGMGGVGKTRLALEVAANSTRAFADGVWVVDLAPVRDPSAVAIRAATALGVPDLGARPVLDQLAAHLAGRRALIVLDNCEHLVKACSELAQTLLSAAGGLRILATSRETLGITGEHVLTVQPLSPDEALELLRDRSNAVEPRFRITDANRAAVTRLCAGLEGLPLAIELAAARLRTLTVEEAVVRLENRFALLSGGSRTALPRQRTLRALVDWSYELCSAPEQRLWNRLSVFTGGFALDAAESVCAGSGIARHEVLDLLDRLVAQSVVLTGGGEDEPRYRLLETIRQYGRQQLARSGEEHTVLRRHRDFYLALAERTAGDWCGPGQEKALARLRAEHANVLTALDCAGDPQATLALAAALRYHWCAGGFLGEGRRRLDRALAAAPEPTVVRARALWVAAWVAQLQGDLAASGRWLEEAAHLGEELGDPVVCAYVQSFRGTLALFRGQLTQAVSLLEGAVDAHTALGEGAGVVFALFELSFVLAHLADPRAAVTGRRALAAAEAHDDRWGRAHALSALGHDAYLRGDLEAAVAMTRTALEIEEGFTDYVGAMLMLEHFAWMTASLGDAAQAVRVLGAADALRRDIGITLAAFPQVALGHARFEEATVAVLGQAGYRRAFAQGGAVDGPARAIAFALRAPEPVAPAVATNPLTSREREVAARVAQGATNRQIASALGRSPRTVEGHIENILAKLGFGSRTQIATWWAQNQVPTP
ncbi:ATP-binding protein [Streptomyces hokutonensis]|uniref:ATP-binding protein n=1 Tax=Streptomyces hokutonensis TaxID=1306990 RepID=UPI0036B9866B